MPVWHAATKEWRESGELTVIGITQEQHPDRTRLFAQWQGIEWPILWDPFNLTGSGVVPNFVLIDEHGVVQGRPPRNPKDLAEEFLAKEHEDPTRGEKRVDLFPFDSRDEFEKEHYGAIQYMLGRGTDRMDAVVATLEEHAKEHADRPELAFRAGVARRLRWDTPAMNRPDDFQAAIDFWVAARAIDPGQYIWRRRIQQYGPKLDKPYPFYDWIARATDEVRARGEDPVAIVAPLTPVELAKRSDFAPAADAEEPDPNGKIPRDDTNLVAVETAVAFDSSGKSPTASVHLTLRPDGLRDVHWANDVEPLAVWVETPDGWETSTRRLEYPQPAEPLSEELRQLALEIRLPDGADQGTVSGYAMYYVCEGEQGQCLFLRRDFEVAVRRPGS